ncbi:MAG: hypothetical protein JSV22_02805 [Bacteroidales bacterium]|nr:MAG: hypothetical protein JSV22_02805 [Bacteroidales bacterium]
MKTKSVLLSISAVAILSVIFLIACEKTAKETKIVYVPEYMTLDEFRSSVKSTSPEEISNPGKIYYKDGYLFVNEVSEGIHIINNNNPANPQKVTFITIPGNNDLAVKGNILYADSYTDLVAIDISDLSDIKEVHRLDSLFFYYWPEVPDYSYDIMIKRDESLIITGWKQKVVSREHERVEFYGYDRIYPFRDAVFFAAETQGFSSSAGTGGSMARFTINDNYLYIVQDYDMNVMDISELYNPIKVTTLNVGWGLETIFQYKNNLFIGSQTGMYIYDLSDPAVPEQLSVFNHLRSCDPVVVDDDYAYVTLRSGTFCMNGNNQLDVIDISDLSNPELVKSYEMNNPHGLGIDNKILFICDGSAGLKIFDAKDPMEITTNKIVNYPGIDAYDVIPLEGTLMLTAKDGIYQYDYSDLRNIKMLSKITIEK